MFSRIANWFLVLFFGRCKTGDQRVILFASYDEKWYEGRWNLRWTDGNRSGLLFGLSWNLWTHFCGFSISTDSDEGGLLVHWAFPPVSFWMRLPINISTAGPRWATWNEKFGGHKGSHKYTNFEFIHLAIHNNALWWTFLKFDWGWSNSMPKWMSGCFHFDDFFLGKIDYSKQIIETRDMLISMPEGDYKATGTLEICTWKRPRWFARVRTYIDVKIPDGIPHEGKGENSWDCGEDGLFGYGYEGDNWREAADKGTQIVLNSRKKYNGNRMAKYPDPALRGFKKTDNSDLNTLLVQAGKGPTPAT